MAVGGGRYNSVLARGDSPALKHLKDNWKQPNIKDVWCLFNVWLVLQCLVNQRFTSQVLSHECPQPQQAPSDCQQWNLQLTTLCNVFTAIYQTGHVLIL